MVLKGGVHGDAVIVAGNNWYGAGLDNAEVNDFINFVWWYWSIVWC